MCYWYVGKIGRLYFVEFHYDKKVLTLIMVSRLENILIVGDEKGPAVSFGSKTGIIEIKGRWVTENPIALNRVMLKWVKE